MALAAVKYFGNNLEQMNCTQQFVELLYHNDHNSYAFLNMKTANKMKQKACLDKCNLIPSDTHTDTWVSLNCMPPGKVGRPQMSVKLMASTLTWTNMMEHLHKLKEPF